MPSTQPPVTEPVTADQIIDQLCSRCHSFTPDRASANALAPNLAAYGQRGPFNAALVEMRRDGDTDWLYRWIADPPSIRPGTAMPPQLRAAGGRLSEPAIRRVVAFLRDLT